MNDQGHHEIQSRHLVILEMCKELRALGPVEQSHGKIGELKITIDDHIECVLKHLSSAHDSRLDCKEQVKVMQINQGKLPQLLKNVEADLRDKDSSKGEMAFLLLLDELKEYLLYEEKQILPLFVGINNPKRFHGNHGYADRS